LVNPYADSRVLYGDENTEIKTVMVGIDAEEPEVLLLDALRTRGKKVDLLIAHHPEGKAYATFYEVMGIQAPILAKYGVPISVAEGLMEPRIKEIGRRVSGLNHTRAVDAAQLLDVPMVCIHTPADNHVASFLQKMFEKEKVERLEDAVKLLKSVPEYKYAASYGQGPKILVGSPDRHVGKVFVDMTGGTEGSAKLLEKLTTAGVSTVIAMHMSDEHYKDAQSANLNVIIAGHISSDNLGLNLLFDKVEKKYGKLNIIPCSGFVRYCHSS
ncbi:MAG: NGG1p interacting factor NIF3, partial [Elusimicrobiota bacterium]